MQSQGAPTNLNYNLLHSPHNYLKAQNINYKQHFSIPSQKWIIHIPRKVANPFLKWTIQKNSSIAKIKINYTSHCYNKGVKKPQHNHWPGNWVCIFMPPAFLFQKPWNWINSSSNSQIQHVTSPKAPFTSLLNCPEKHSTSKHSPYSQNKLLHLKKNSYKHSMTQAH